MIGKLFIVSAPSGAGKTSLIEDVLPRLKQQYPIDRLITYTSRQERPGEQNTVDFNFISDREFEEKIKEGFFIEWSKAYDHYYGSPAHVVDDLKRGQSRILVIDRLGATQVLKGVSSAVTIWIRPPSVHILKSRLLVRNVNTLAQIDRRIELAKSELKQEAENRSYKYHLLNDIFDEASQKLESIFLKELKKINM